MRFFDSCIEFLTSMHPVAYIEIVSVLACLAAIVFVIRGWKRPGFLPATLILLLILLMLMMFYGIALVFEWSGWAERFRWHFIEDFASIFIPFIWAFVFYAVVKNAVEEDLRTSREHFQNLVESTSDWTWEIDAVGRYTYISPQIRDILGYDPKEIIGKTPFELMPSDEAERVSVIFADILEKRQPFQNLQNVNLHKDGHEVVLETNGVPILDKKGNLKGFRGVDRDITGRLETEQLQKQQQEELDSVFRASPAGVGLVRDRKLIRGNTRFFQITGYPEEELTGMDPRRLYHSKQDYQDVGAKYTEALAKGFARIETRFVRKDQRVIDVVIYISPMDRDNADKGFAVVIQDITEFKAARQQAMEEKTRAQLYLDVAGVMIVVLDTKGHVKLINRMGCEILERRADEIEGADWFKFLPSSYQQITQNAFGRIISGEAKSVEYFENPVCTPDGVEKLIAWHNTILRDESGKVTGVISSGEDITQTRAAQEAVRESSQRLRMALSAAKMGTWQMKAGTHQETRDASLNALLGLEPVETTQDADDFFTYIHPDERDSVKEEFEQAIQKSEVYLARFRIIRADNGQVRWVLDQGKPFFDFNGKLEYVTGAIVDITEQVEYQQRYQNVIDSAPMGILTYELDADDRLVLTGTNNAANTILGKDYSTSVGKTIEEVFPELMSTSLPHEYRRVCKNGGTYHGDNFEYQDAQVSGLYEFDAFQTSPNNMAVAFTDVTERRQTEHQLRFTQFAVDHAGEAAYWMGPDAKFIYVNDKACQSLGYTHEELLTLGVQDIDPDFPADIWPEHWNQVRQAELMRFESHHKKKDGTVFPVEITANFVTYDGHEYMCSFVRNITDRKAAEQEREILMQQLRERNDELQSIVFTAAHDLRSPLVNIAGFTGELEKSLKQLEELLGDQKLGKQVAEKVEYLLETDIAESLGFVRSGSQHMDMLLNGLMRLSVVGAASIEQGPVDMKDVFDGIIEGLQYQINENIIDISVPNDLPDCTGDFTMLTQIFGNLIDNAIKYRDSDRAAVVEIGASIKDDMVEYTVADNGIGIESAHLEKVFELFHRLDSKQDKEGQGLGLTIVRRILDRLGGSARIDSTPGLGTTVHVWLPKA